MEVFNIALHSLYFATLNLCDEAEAMARCGLEELRAVARSRGGRRNVGCLWKRVCGYYTTVGVLRSFHIFDDY